MSRNTRPQKRSDTQAKANARTRRRPSWWSWAAIAVPVFALAAVMLLGGGDDSGSDDAIGSPAPGFDLPTADGSRQTLDGVLANGDALLYFSMGPGCDGCFHQIPEIADDLAEQGITLVPVMVDPAPRVATEAQRFGIVTPILIDADRSVSEAYDMIGVYGHQDRPSHSFALVDQQGQIKWVKHYAEMFVPLDRLLADLGAPA
ncbi:MAG: peroxiredoxin family protein [Actinomycetia bacterium]|nr:peroxiredoxin family protein [Actinomycetes bacterium]